MKFASTPFTRFRFQGETLLEVLVTLVIISVGLAGLAYLQISTMQRGHETTAYTAATQLTTELAEYVRANPQALVEGWYTDPAAAVNSTCEIGTVCGLQAFTQTGLKFWQAGLQSRLTNATAHICWDTSPDDGSPGAPLCDGAGDLQIKIWWSQLDGSLQNYQARVGLI